MNLKRPLILRIRPNALALLFRVVITFQLFSSLAWHKWNVSKDREGGEPQTSSNHVSNGLVYPAQPKKDGCSRKVGEKLDFMNQS